VTFGADDYLLLMILHSLQDGIRLKVEFVGYDPNSYRVSCGEAWRAHGSGYVSSGFVSVFDCSQFSPPYIYIL
jgi:hypothetical protein